MDTNWNVTFIDLHNLISITKSDKKHMLKYLNQFQELIPTRIESLKKSLAAEDRKLTRQILHQMSPQLQFFGVPGILTPIRRLEHEYRTMSLENLKELVNEILIKLDGAINDVENVIKNNFYQN
jgi:HPt (histidine-containing phosphotransfer) domain-containing protein